MKLPNPFVDFRFFVTEEIRMNQRFLFLPFSRETLWDVNLGLLKVNNDFLLRLESLLLKSVGFETVKDLSFVFFLVKIVDFKCFDVVD